MPVKVDCNDRSTKEFATKSGVYAAVKTNLSDCFCLAFTAPSCLGQLLDVIGFLGDTDYMQQIPEGTYIFPGGTGPRPGNLTIFFLEEAASSYASLSNEEVEHMSRWKISNTIGSK